MNAKHISLFILFFYQQTQTTNLCPLEITGWTILSLGICEFFITMKLIHLNHKQRNAVHANDGQEKNTQTPIPPSFSLKRTLRYPGLWLACGSIKLCAGITQILISKVTCYANS